MTEPISLRDIDLAAEDYRRDYDALAQSLSGLRQAQMALVQEHLPNIRRRLHLASESKEVLAHRLDQAKAAGLFLSPKTRVLHGLKVGFQKARRRLSWTDPAAIIASVRQWFPNQAAQIIRVEERIHRPALEGLTEQALQTLGVRVEEGEDERIIKAVDSELDRLVSVMLDQIQPDLEARHP